MAAATLVAAVGAVSGGCGQVDEPDPLAQDCAFYAAMDEESWSGAIGEVRDSCGGDDPGTARPGVTTVPNGRRGRAGSFPTREACIEVPDSPRLRPSSALTMSAWVMPTALDGTSQEAFGIISKRAQRDVDDSYNLSLWTGDRAWVELDDSVERFPAMAVVRNARWTQLTVVYDGTRLKGERVRVFQDGVLDTVGTENSASLGGSPIPLRIGCMPSVDAGVLYNQGFLGLLDDVVVWTRALRDAEVADWYERTRP